MADTTETTERAVGRVTVTMVYTGRMRPAKGTVGYSFRLVNLDGTLGEERGFAAKELRSLVVGGIYEVDAGTPEAHSIYSATAHFSGRWQDQQAVLNWYARDRAFGIKDAQDAMERKEKTRNLILEAVEPLRKAYLATNWENRQALVNLIEYYIHNGKLPNGA